MTGTDTCGHILRENVRTAQETELRLRPFDVLNVRTRRKWDPSTRTLWVTWDINDRNGRIRNGRIRYLAVGPDGNDVCVHQQRLDRRQTRHGEGHRLLRPERWDGTITEGLTDRLGKKVTADLSRISAIVEVWNTDHAAPAATIPKSRGRTQREGEWLAVGLTDTEVDAIVEAKWDRSFVIPYGDPDEPDKGEAKAIVRVKNVRQGTTAHISVFRINKIDNAASDYVYPSPEYNGEQLGLEDLVVREVKGELRVVRPDDSDPFVRFDDYSEHWKYPGNNYYAFTVSFGDYGTTMAASERNHVKKRRRCLHMRFTVFIHCPTPHDEYGECGKKLWKFLKKETDYYRPYLLLGGAKSATDWLKRFQHRYIVVILGHGGSICYHEQHPKIVKSGKKKSMPMYPRRYDPDRHVCPDRIEDSPEARAELKGLEHQLGTGPQGGCGHESHVYACSILGPVGNRGGHMCIASIAGQPTTKLPRLYVDKPRQLVPFGGKNIHPRLFMYTGACRQVVTKRMGERFTRHGTRYFHGWAWGVYLDPPEQSLFCLDFFKKWIKGSEVEYDIDRFYPAYCAAAKRPHVSSHPRLLEGRNVWNARPGPDKIEMALE